MFEGINIITMFQYVRSGILRNKHYLVISWMESNCYIQ